MIATIPRRNIVVAILVAAILIAAGPRPIFLEPTRTGDTTLAGTLAAQAPPGSKALAVANHDGDTTTFAGLGADEHTQFEIGSITKMFTVELLRQAVERGEISLDAPVSSFVAFPSDTVTIRDLANHTSGLPRLPRNLVLRSVTTTYLNRNPYAGITASDVLDQAKDQPLSNVGTYQYSNYGYALLGQILAQQAQTPYPELVATRILRPLAMANTRVATTESPEFKAGYLATGHHAATWPMDGYAPAGAIVSTADDLARFAQHVQEHGIPDYGWIRKDGFTFHNGMTGGFSSILAFDEAKRSFALGLSNTTATPTTLVLEVLSP
ncbi:MAG: serine hydrolase domain-containing protein [Corynebacterium sp.]|uniref:serine hydrolase domain-containing protein n=1 Tax=Corynebacterium sp. TaxID=1720 RepID=UPI0026DB14E1|nr:serine hydrolase domain-containing protein [Corynebacterium sp.]MDO5099731.1 serine hydrolase domain-containing protein [Corynebacterium sp.]